jgi:carbonic anhydrase/acetyltransferase-like protein (isoleucine patch superfamily)
MVMGSPAKVARPLRAEELAQLQTSAAQYVEYAASYRP